MKFLSAAGISALLIINGLISAPHSFGQTQAAPVSDFIIAVQAGLQSLAVNPAAQSRQQEIQNQDYKSTWDEFGINTLVEGSTPPAEVKNQITRDIVQSVEIAQNYNQQEASYLQAAQITPEQVQAAESLVGTDLPPSEPVNPNPSINANPDANTSPADVPLEGAAVDIASSSDIEVGNESTSTNEITAGTNAAEASTSTSEISTSTINAATTTMEIGSSTLEASSSVQGVASSTQGVSSSTLDLSSSTLEAEAGSSTAKNISTADENTIFEAILQSEQSQPADQTPTSSDITVPPAPPADSAPSAP